MKNSRLVAFEILYSVLQENAYSNIAVDRALADTECDNKALATRLVYGVIERKITLDYVISQYLTEHTKPKVKILLYIGAYQILFMDKIPNSVAVNESVELADCVRVGYYKKLINAVLRKIADSDFDINTVEDLEIKYSCPKPLINKWIKAYGMEKALSVLEAINNKPPVFAIPNSLYVDAVELQYELLDEGIDSQIYEDVLIITSSFNLNTCRSFKNGLFYIEDYSSYLCAKRLSCTEGDIVLDVCSAPGGKTFTLAQNMNNKGKVYAFDLYEHRVDLVKAGAQRLGLSNIEFGVNDATVFNDNLPKADKILCDVVCSGFGIIRRKPEIRYKNLDEIKELPNIQYDILQTSSRYLKNGGQIIYSTCTLNNAENENVVSKFLDNNDNFSLIEQKTIFPCENGGDGFFWALMEKNND